jgi:hypothetical protein
MNRIEALLGLAEHHKKQAGHFEPFGDTNALTVFHDDAEAICRLAADDIATLRADLERERMRLVACGVVAMSDTPESAAKARDMHPDYRSASCDDVARRVDECIALRAQRDRLLAALTNAHAALVEHPAGDTRPDEEAAECAAVIREVKGEQG